MTRIWLASLVISVVGLGFHSALHADASDQSAVTIKGNLATFARYGVTVTHAGSQSDFKSDGPDLAFPAVAAGDLVRINLRVRSTDKASAPSFLLPITIRVTPADLPFDIQVSAVPVEYCDTETIRTSAPSAHEDEINAIVRLFQQEHDTGTEGCHRDYTKKFSDKRHSIETLLNPPFSAVVSKHPKGPPH